METWIVQKADGKQRAACISSAVCLSLAAGVFTQRGSVETSTWKLSRPCGRPTATRGPWKKIIIPPFHSTLASLVNKETFLQIFFPYRTIHRKSTRPSMSFLSQKVSWTTRRTTSFEECRFYEFNRTNFPLDTSLLLFAVNNSWTTRKQFVRKTRIKACKGYNTTPSSPFKALRRSDISKFPRELESIIQRKISSEASSERICGQLGNSGSSSAGGCFVGSGRIALPVQMLTRFLSRFPSEGWTGAVFTRIQNNQGPP